MLDKEKKIIVERELKFKKGLTKYLPEEVLDYLANKLAQMPVFLKVVRNRRSKLGDYTPAHSGKPHTITVNHNLNKYSFFITLVHEMAHYECWHHYKNRVKPHGAEWKKCFKDLMDPLLDKEFLPADIHSDLIRYMSNPLASSCTDISLMRSLKKYDDNQSGLIFLEHLPENSFFTMSNGKTFQKD